MNDAGRMLQDGAEKWLQLKSDSLAAGHRQALRQRVNRCWDLLQQQHQQAVGQRMRQADPGKAGRGE